jgi:predicted transcriptional regulator
MEPLMIAADVVSVAVFVVFVFFATKVIQAFKQSKQALTESASLISVIVDALSSRVEQSESVVNQVQTEIEGLKTRGAGLEWEQASLRSSHLQLLHSLQEILTNDRRLIGDLEQLKARLASPQGSDRLVEPPSKRADLSGFVGQSSILDSLTPTERETLNILSREGPKAAPELGKRLKKSREHASRLMKKLYLEGYVDRESNRAPFRYRLTDTVRSVFAPSSGQIMEKASERA